jgi:membrane associated rhomboid family serine protease
MFNIFGNLPMAVKNLLIINGLFFLAQLAFPEVNQRLAMYAFSSPRFEFVQVITHFFMHSTFNIMHIVFNMYALVLFGSHLERVWGAQRFLFFYFISAIGAALLHSLVVEWEIAQLIADMPQDVVNKVRSEGIDLWMGGQNYVDSHMGALNAKYNVPVLGASGAVFGILAGFAYLFPNTELMLLFPPIPIKAKWFVLIYAGIELYLGFANNPHDNVAHFAHLGGALFGFIMVYYWQKQNRDTFY